MRMFALALTLMFVSGGVIRAEDKKPQSVLDFTMKDIDGKDVDLSKYKGKVIMVVNVASKCGLTPQYKALEKVYTERKDKGFVIIAFPANEFGKQEPGTNAQIKEFCTETYHVTFDMFSKIVVKGDGQHPLYKFLTSEETNKEFAGDIKWNFTKFVIDREGKVVKRIEPKTAPDSEEALKIIDAELEKAVK